MIIQNDEIYKLNFFNYKRAFTGSKGNMRYRIIQKEREEKKIFEAAVYPQPYCWEETEEGKKQKKEFSFCETGRMEMIEWLNQKLKEFQSEDGTI